MDLLDAFTDPAEIAKLSPEQQIFLTAFINALQRASQGGAIGPNEMSPLEESIAVENALAGMSKINPVPLLPFPVPGTRDQQINVPRAVQGPMNPFRGQRQ